MLLLLNGVAGAPAPNFASSAAELKLFQDGAPVAGLVNLSGAEPWNNAQEGFAWVRARPTDLGPTSGFQYLLDLNTGSSNPSAGIRIANSDEEQEARYRADGGNLATAGINARTTVEGALRSFGLSWSNALGKLWLVGAGAIKDYNFTPGTFAAPGFSRLYVGARNSSNEPFTGTFAALEIGNQFLNPATLAARMRHSDQLTIIGAGQSLMGGYWGTQESDAEPGPIVFTQETAAVLSDVETITIDGTTGSSALSNKTDADNYWWNEDTDTPGPAYDTFLIAARAVCAAPDWCFWALGESDSFALNKPEQTSRSTYKTMLLKLFAHMRADLNPAMKIGIQGIGRRAGSFSNTGGIQDIREVQQELALETAWVHMLGYSYHQSLFDAVHLNDAGYLNVGGALMRRALATEGVSVSSSTIGPRIVSASRTGTSITVNLAHDGGSDFTPASGIVGFRFFDESGEITITGAVRSDANTVMLTLTGSPVSGEETLYYCYDDAADITNANISNVLRDNTGQALPLIPAKITLS